MISIHFDRVALWDCRYRVQIILGKCYDFILAVTTWNLSTSVRTVLGVIQKSRQENDNDYHHNYYRSSRAADFSSRIYNTFSISTRSRKKRLGSCSISFLVHPGRSPGMISLCLSASRIYNTFSISTRSRKKKKIGR